MTIELERIPSAKLVVGFNKPLSRELADRISKALSVEFGPDYGIVLIGDVSSMILLPEPERGWE
jgi:hypothetical protein